MNDDDIVHVILDRAIAGLVHVVEDLLCEEPEARGTSTHAPAEWGAAFRNWGALATDGGAGS